MNTTTLRGVFPEPKPVHRRNFVRENIKQLKEIQGFIKESKIPSQSQEIKPNKFKHVAPKVYSNITARKRLSKDQVAARPHSFNEVTRPPRALFFGKKFSPEKTTTRGVQTERPEDVTKMYETGPLKYPSPAVAKVKLSHRGRDQGDAPLAQSMQKLDLEDKQNYIKQNIKNIKVNKQKREESPDPTKAPPEYQKGVLPRYLKEKKVTKDEKSGVFEENISGLVLLPDDERREYLRVARENYAALIKELNSMPVSNDTLKKRKRKMEIEDELKRIDEVIKIFQKPKVFVKADA
ncbi:enkurin domain-containing protein 1-like isoform X1 [Tribolium madens]|uniref:enkurin domain-containing protein 1-like isoform X1 n=1 Tax=Tribolium madens TaxID=41895 RepID=UPI001CF75229|nr:enkurin domain-containing protein 1-like isoform X1 [Tribolium madens]